MRGPALDQNISRSSEFRTIQVKPGSARSAGVLNLDPKSTYYFQVIPSAGRTAGEPSKQHRIGPGTAWSTTLTPLTIALVTLLTYFP